MTKPRIRKTTRRVGTRGQMVPLYLTEAALEVWYSTPVRERSKRVQNLLLQDTIPYAHNPTREKADK